jgi:uroporphyrinogen-III synthase
MSFDSILDQIEQPAQSDFRLDDRRRSRMAQQGLRALVTRPREEAGALAAALAARGIEAVVEPLMQVHYRPPAALDLAGVQAILCTSANGVRALARTSKEREVLLLAIGDATAAHARSEGFTAVESAGGDVADLVSLAAARLRPQGGTLLHVAGSVVAGDLVETLGERGFRVERLVLYEAQPAKALSPTTVDALRGGSIDFAFFLSPRTAAIFAQLAAAAGVVPCCAKMTALSISRAADAALADFPWLDRRVAERPNQSALLAAFDRVLCERSAG